MKKLTAAIAIILLLTGVTKQTGAAAEADFESYPTIIADCSDIQREITKGIFGYILTPNYDIPDSRMSLLGNLLNRETIPVQNFQAISDLNGAYYEYEHNMKERLLSAYKRAKGNGFQFYFLLGMSPSWAAPSGGPVDTWDNVPVKTDEQIKDFKQYTKDVLQFMRDNGALPDFADMTNEYWTGTEEIYHAVWESLREVYPEFIPAVGPGAVGYDGIPDYYIPYAAENDITVEGPSWHAFWKGDTYVKYSQLQKWYDGIAKIQAENKKANGKYIIWEENNSDSILHSDWTRSMSNVVRTGVDFNIKGCLEGENWNGMSDLMTTNLQQQNGAYRRTVWWVYYMFSQMSGSYVNVDISNAVIGEPFTGAVGVDEEAGEIKVILAKDKKDGPVLISLDNVPFDLNNVTIDLYKITETENNGLEYQTSVEPNSIDGDKIDFLISEAKADDSWMAIVKTENAKPSFFVPLTPDDGEAAINKPNLTWSESRGADSYNLTLSKNKDLSNPIIKLEGITETSYQISESLENDIRYYWGIEAVNENGVRILANNTKYSFIVKDNIDVPGQFGPYLPSIGSVSEAVNLEFLWSTAYNADSYRLVVSKNKDLSDPFINRSGIARTRDTGQFGIDTQVYYELDTGEERLEFDTTYYWTVYAVNENGERPMNNVGNYFTTKSKGLAPVEFNLVYPGNGAENVAARSVLEWEHSPNAFFYHLEISDTQDMSNIILERPHMIYNRYTLEPDVLEPQTTYYWRVTAITKNKKYSTENSGGIQSFTTDNLPCSPLLYAEQEGEEPGTVNLWFHNVKNADYYNIYFGTAEGEYTRKISNVTGEEYTVSGLEGGREYYFAISATNAEGESLIWNERSVVPSGDESILELPGEEVSVMLSEVNVIPKLSPELIELNEVNQANQENGTDNVNEDDENVTDKANQDDETDDEKIEKIGAPFYVLIGAIVITGIICVVLIRRKIISNK